MGISKARPAVRNRERSESCPFSHSLEQMHESWQKFKTHFQLQTLLAATSRKIMPNFVRTQNLVSHKQKVRTSVHLYFHGHLSETCIGMCGEKLLGGSIPLNHRTGEVGGYKQSFNIRTSSVTMLHLWADLHIAFPGTSPKICGFVPSAAWSPAFFFFSPITLLLNHPVAALAHKASFNKPLLHKAGRHREPRDADNPVACYSHETATRLQGGGKMGDWEHWS